MVQASQVSSVFFTHAQVSALAPLGTSPIKKRGVNKDIVTKASCGFQTSLHRHSAVLVHAAARKRKGEKLLQGGEKRRGTLHPATVQVNDPCAPAAPSLWTPEKKSGKKGGRGGKKMLGKKERIKTYPPTRNKGKGRHLERRGSTGRISTFEPFLSSRTQLTVSNTKMEGGGKRGFSQEKKPGLRPCILTGSPQFPVTKKKKKKGQKPLEVQSRRGPPNGCSTVLQKRHRAHGKQTCFGRGKRTKGRARP